MPMVTLGAAQRSTIQQLRTITESILTMQVEECMLLNGRLATSRRGSLAATQYRQVSPMVLLILPNSVNQP